MNQALEVVKSYYQAFEDKNFEKMRSLLHDGYTFKGPMMEFDSADACIAQMNEGMRL